MADENADDFAFGVEQRCATLAALDSNVGADVPRGKVAPEVFDIEPADGAESGRERKVHRKADGDDGRSYREISGFSEGEERGLGIDFQNGNPAAQIADEAPCGEVLMIEGDRDVARFAADGVR